MKHTPGPWKQSGSTIYSETEGVSIAIMSNRATNTADNKPIEVWDKGWKNAMADASLIAAAPELLDALEQIKSIPAYAYGDNEAACHMVDIAAAAIQKAEQK